MQAYVLVSFFLFGYFSSIPHRTYITLFENIKAASLHKYLLHHRVVINDVYDYIPHKWRFIPLPFPSNEKIEFVSSKNNLYFTLWLRLTTDRKVNTVRQPE